MKILVPDYFINFKCKCGECRHCCCNGWGITVSFEEYCKLLSIECSSELRHKIDCAFHILKDASNDRYAMINMNYLGNCPLQREDGYCALQCECGEEILPKICKYYPRNTFLPENMEGACANSCEKVVEMLMEEENGVNFKEIEVNSDSSIRFSQKDYDIQMEAISMLKDRKYTVGDRLIKLGKLLNVDDTDLIKEDESEIFQTLFKVIEEIEDYSPSFKEFSSKADKNIKLVKDEDKYEFDKERYIELKNKFKDKFPNNEIYFENLMNNHLFFERFPSVERGETIKDKYLELCGVFALLRYIGIAYTFDEETKEDLVDCVASLFRCFEHSNVNMVIKNTLKGLGKLTYGFIKEMIEVI